MIVGCTNNDAKPKAVVSGADGTIQAAAGPGCLGCHPLSMDQKHDFSCTDCHGGEAKANAKLAAHTGLIGQPAHPDHLATICGKCHGAIVQQATGSLHFTIANKINLIRQAFGSADHLTSLTAIPQPAVPSTPLQLTDDLLRRRCLRCHLYSSGEAYAATRHGAGCAGCHLAFADGRLSGHQFLAQPTDQQCLSCHYGNRVGADYYGRFEQDFNWDYRTPFRAAAGDDPPPYGVGFHQLSPDLHQHAGMVCIDCHSGQELMAGGAPITCRSCHAPVLGLDAPPSLTEADGRRLLNKASSGKRFEVPVMKDPAHGRYGEGVGCQVCHGQWSFSDHGNHLLRQDDPDYESWQALTQQGSAELQAKLEGALFQETVDSEASMTDGITGTPSLGLWLQAYEVRRWEEINTCLDAHGVLQVCRPILDLHLSFVNQDGEVIFDGVKPDIKTPVMLPYTPHTTGRAGAFYRQRISSEVSLP